MNVKLISKTQPEVTNSNTEFIAYVARVSSTRSKNNRHKEYNTLLKYLIANKHWSPFEHVYLSFEIVTNISISMQLLRHRSMVFQQLSRRYNSESPEFEPIELRVQSKVNRQGGDELFDDTDHKFADRILKLQELCAALYMDMINAGVANECARGVLPQSLQTELIMTGNVRSWLHFLNLRLDAHAQKEARLIAQEIERLLRLELPELFDL